ncbi:type II secretion system protein GspD [Alkanindiges hydrocarboniclasticus]|uniref:Type II secretion system protein GspD n=1 Tax=Alkanindiges hydrocarboniclasticus TaxID=1907941 RepID=A0A1S8CTY8_9GAMM|nr:type II secretion system secretin GspD [Alkanindiges hydrocarboniclasticus]ONG38509.1 type II secretion system protein GspD [Alkanindiges hydrocarboniclasticus]
MANFAHKRSAYGVFMALPLLAALAFPANAQTWKINLRDADLTAFVNEVADITGKNFAVDPRVKGTVTVISNKELTRDQVYDLFLGVLNVNGVVAVPSGNTIKLVPDTNARSSGTPFDSRNRIRGELVVTRVIWLQNTNPSDLIPAIRPLMPQYAHLAAIPGTNALIVSDRAENIEQIEKLVSTLDGTGDNDMEAIPLRNSQAEEIIGLVDAMSATGSSRDVRGSRVRLIADARSNRLLVKGDAQSRKRIRELVQMLDVVPADRLGGLRVFRLRHASAKNLAQMLQGLVTGQNTSSGSNSTSSNTSSFSNSSNNTTTGTTSNTGSSSSLGSGASVNLTGLGSNSNNNNSNQLSTFTAGGISIIADETQNALIVKAEPALMREIESAIDQLDSRRSQVLIEAAIVEVSGSTGEQLGIQWALGDLTSGVGLINFSNVGASLAQLGAGVAAGGTAAASVANQLAGAAIALGDVREKNGQTNFYGALIQALDSNSKANLLSVPSVLTLDNEEAHIVVGQNVPFITGSATLTSGGTASPYQTVERKDVGLTLKVIPHIGDGGTIRLEVEQEVSAVVPANNAISKTDITTTKRLIKTAILAEDQQTIVLGGLIQDDNTSTTQAVPGLSKIPVLGRLFRSDNDSHEKRNLLVFLHPTIIRDGQSVNALTQKRYGQVRSLQLILDPNGNITRLPEQIDRIYGDSTTDATTNPSMNTIDKTPVAIQRAVTTPVINPPVVVVTPMVDVKPATPVTSTTRDGNTVIQTTIRSE